MKRENKVTNSSITQCRTQWQLISHSPFFQKERVISFIEKGIHCNVFLQKLFFAFSSHTPTSQHNILHVHINLFTLPATTITLSIHFFFNICEPTILPHHTHFIFIFFFINYPTPLKFTSLFITINTHHNHTFLLINHTLHTTKKSFTHCKFYTTQKHNPLTFISLHIFYIYSIKPSCKNFYTPHKIS